MKAINQQIAGPIHYSGQGELEQGRYCERLIGSVYLENVPEQRIQTGYLLAASYTAFDKAGRELGIDATELAQKVDIAALIRELGQVLLEAEYNEMNQETSYGRDEARNRINRIRAAIPADLLK